MKTKLLFMLLLFLCVSTAWGQSKSISGKVTSTTDNEPVIGASVVVKGTTNGTITDFDGNFTLSADANSTLVISFVGYVTQEIALSGNTSVNVLLKEDTQMLDEAGVTRAAVETVAENASDGVIAPMLYTALGGPVLGFLYKAVNTMDSMVGYKNDRYLHFGRAAAKLDDVVNFFPARISALLMIGAAFLSGKSYNGRQAWRIWRRDNRKHASPNSAQTESVCAGALGIQLAGDASYFGKVVKKPYIGDPTRAVEPEDIRRSHTLLYMTAVLALVVFEVVKVLVCLWYFTVQV